MKQNEDKPYHHGDLQNELLRIAARLGRELGPEAVTIRQVTREAGVSPTSAYRHYRDQSALMSEVARIAGAELSECLEAALAEHRDKPTTERILAACFAYYTFAIDEPNFFRCLLASKDFSLPHVFGVDERVKETPIPADHPLTPVTRVFHELAVERTGDEKPDFIITNIISVWSAVHGYTVLSIDDVLAVMSPDEPEIYARRVFTNAIRGINFSAPEELEH